MKRLDLWINYLQQLFEIIEFYRYRFKDEYRNNISQLEKLLDYDFFNLIINSDNTNILNNIQQTLISIIKNVCNEINDHNTYQKTNFKFLIVAFTDELLIKEFDEISLDNWNTLLLEKYFFGTSIAGEKVIEIINEHNKYHAQKNNIMSIINYMILCGGFTGIYKENINEILRLKNTTFKMLKNDFNIYNQLDSNIFNNNLYEMLKGPNSCHILNYSTVYFRIFIAILLLEFFFVFYLIFKYFEIKFCM